MPLSLGMVWVFWRGLDRIYSGGFIVGSQTVKNKVKMEWESQGTVEHKEKRNPGTS